MSKKLKLRVKNTIMDKTLTYALENWILTKTHYNRESKVK
jgi:hypothetical protein